MITHKSFEQYLLDFPDTWLEFPFGENISVYKVGDTETKEGKIFALIMDESNPLRINLKCDPLLAKTLRERYESVQPGWHMNKKHWNTIICTGQIPDDEVHDLARLSYLLASGRETV